jgi:HTH-type transcriptional regulator, glycine betaine synthesis regulator
VDDTLGQARDTFIQGMSHISQYWGFPKAMGAIYGAIYLSPEPVSLDELVVLVGVTKGAVSTNVRALERLGMVHRHIRIGERKDYYVAETDFWKVVRGILKERQESEFDQAIGSVSESLELAQAAVGGSQAELAAFYQARLQNLAGFFHSLDNLVAMVLALDELRFNTLQKLLGKAKDEAESG